MTSSARASSPAETLRPSAFAVRRKPDMRSSAREHRRDGRANRRIKPKPPASLAFVPDGDDLLSFRDGFALGLGALGLLSGLHSCSLLGSAVRVQPLNTH